MKGMKGKKYENRNADFSTHERFDLVIRIFKSEEKIARFFKTAKIEMNECMNGWKEEKKERFNEVGNKCEILCTDRSLYGACCTNCTKTHSHTYIFQLQFGRLYQCRALRCRSCSACFFALSILFRSINYGFTSYCFLAL